MRAVLEVLCRTVHDRTASRWVSARRSPCLLLVLLVTALPAADEADGWRSMLGPQHNCSVRPAGRPLISDMGQAKPVWQGEEILPCTCSDGPKGQTGLQGGSATMAYDDGRLFLWYFIGSGTVTDKDMWPDGKRLRKLNEPYKKNYASVLADDIFLAVDVRDGRTLWKRVFKERGPVRPGKMYGPLLSPVAADGVVYGSGMGATVYALDAETGEPLWEQPIPGWSDKLAAMAATARKERRYPPGKTRSDLTGQQSSLALVEDVVVVPMHKGNRGARHAQLYAFDRRSGELRWGPVGSGGCRHGVLVPHCWRFGDREYLIDGASCFDPRNGEKLWSVDDVGHLSVIAGDVLVFACSSDSDQPTIPAYRMRPAGVSELWRTPYPDGFESLGTAAPVITEGHVYLPIERRNGNFRRAEDVRVICLELDSGEIVANLQPPTGMQTYMPWVAGEGLLVFGYQFVQLFAADPSNLRALPGTWPAPPPAMMNTGILLNGHYFYRGRDRLHCVDLRR